MRISPFLILIFFCQSLIGQKPVILSDFVEQVHISDMQLHYISDPDCGIQPADLFKGIMDQDFRVVDFSTHGIKRCCNIPGFISNSGNDNGTLLCVFRAFQITADPEKFPY